LYGGRLGPDATAEGARLRGDINRGSGDELLSRLELRLGKKI
jgi:hypothetical protein